MRVSPPFLAWRSRSRAGCRAPSGPLSTSVRSIEGSTLTPSMRHDHLTRRPGSSSDRPGRRGCTSWTFSPGPLIVRSRTARPRWAVTSFHRPGHRRGWPGPATGGGRGRADGPAEVARREAEMRAVKLAEHQVDDRGEGRRDRGPPRRRRHTSGGSRPSCGCPAVRRRSYRAYVRHAQVERGPMLLGQVDRPARPGSDRAALLARRRVAARAAGLSARLARPPTHRLRRRKGSRANRRRGRRPGSLAPATGPARSPAVPRGLGLRSSGISIV